MKEGISLMETVITMLLTSVVLAIVFLILSMTFRISSQIHNQLVIDEEIMKLNGDLKYLLSRNWTGLIIDEDFDGNTITLESRFPLIPEATVATITYYDGKLLFIYQHSEEELSTLVIAEHLGNFAFLELEGQYLYYEALFQYRGISKEIDGAVRIY